MRCLKSSLAALAIVAAVGLAGPAASVGGDGGRGVYEIKVTNLTKGQDFAPIVAASHRRGVRFFKLGQPASRQLESLAEEGDIGPLERVLRANRRVLDTDSTFRHVRPGRSVTLRVRFDGPFNRISLAGMLVPTNDGFVALNGVRGPGDRAPLTLRAPGYDAGSEANDELCTSLPAPARFCGATPRPGPAPDAEGFVHIHRGIQGIGNLDEAVSDWRNPIAEIVIRRLER